MEGRNQVVLAGGERLVLGRGMEAQLFNESSGQPDGLLLRASRKDSGAIGEVNVYNGKGAFSLAASFHDSGQVSRLLLGGSSGTPFMGMGFTKEGLLEYRSEFPSAREEVRQYFNAKGEPTQRETLIRSGD